MNNINNVDLTEGRDFQKEENFSRIKIKKEFQINDKEKLLKYGIEYIDINDKERLRYAADNPDEFNANKCEDWKVKIYLIGEYCECCGEKTNNGMTLCEKCNEYLNNKDDITKLLYN